MLTNVMISPLQSAYASRLVLVPKKDVELHFCVDYRKLDVITKSDPTPLPHISDTIRSLGDAKVLTTIDLESGY